MPGVCPCEGNREETEADCKDHGWAAGKNFQQLMSCFHLYIFWLVWNIALKGEVEQATRPGTISCANGRRVQVVDYLHRSNLDWKTLSNGRPTTYYYGMMFTGWSYHVKECQMVRRKVRWGCKIDCKLSGQYPYSAALAVMVTISDYGVSHNRVESCGDDHEHNVPEAGVFWCTLILINAEDDNWRWT